MPDWGGRTIECQAATMSHGAATQSSGAVTQSSGGAAMWAKVGSAGRCGGNGSKVCSMFLRWAGKLLQS